MVTCLVFSDFNFYKMFEAKYIYIIYILYIYIYTYMSPLFEKSQLFTVNLPYVMFVTSSHVTCYNILALVE